MVELVFVINRYKATIYPCPEKMEERRDMLDNLRVRIADLQIVRSNFHICRLHEIATHVHIHLFVCFSMGIL